MITQAKLVHTLAKVATLTLPFIGTGIYLPRTLKEKYSYVLLNVSWLLRSTKAPHKS